MKKVILFLFLINVYSCSYNDVDLSDENYVFNGKGGIKCDVNGINLEPTLKLSPGNSSTRDLSFISYDGENYMSLSFYNDDQDPDFIFQSIRIKILNITPNQNLKENIYILKNELNGDNYGHYLHGSFEHYCTTNDDFTGELKIIFHDIKNRILGGTFWFDSINSDGEITEIRNGEFDMKY